MKLLILAVGKMRDPHWRKLTAQYVDRTAHYLPIAVTEVRESNASEPDARKREEGAALLGAAPRDAILVAMDERGEAWTSAQLAAWVEERMIRGTRYVAFTIGGPEGLDEEVRSAADTVLSLSSMTLPHDMARTLLAEQLYRAMTIIRGEPYHR